MTSHHHDHLERRLKLLTHSLTEYSFSSTDDEVDFRLPPELLVTQDLGVTDSTIVIISQRVDVNEKQECESQANELILKATVRYLKYITEFIKLLQVVFPLRFVGEINPFIRNRLV